MRFVAAYAAAPPARSSHQGKPEPDLPTLPTGLDWLDPADFGVDVGVDVPKIITRAVSTRSGVGDCPEIAEGCEMTGGKVDGGGVAVS